MSDAEKTITHVARQMSAQAPFLAWAVVVATAMLGWLLYDSHQQTERLVNIQVKALYAEEKRTDAILEMAMENRNLASEIKRLNDLSDAQVNAVIARLDAGREVIERLMTLIVSEQQRAKR